MDRVPPPGAVWECPVCKHPADRLGGRRVQLTGCGHALCSECLAGVAAAGGRCPLCRDPDGARANRVVDHQPLAVAAELHRCPGCGERWDSEAHYPTVALPCRHPLCRSCASDPNKPCNRCGCAVTSAVDDALAHEALCLGRVPPAPAPEPSAAPAPAPAPSPAPSFNASVVALCHWVARHPEVLRQDFGHGASSPRSLWPERKRALYNEAMALALDIGRSMPLDNPEINPFSLRTALNMGSLGLCVESEVRSVHTAREARERFDPEVRSALGALPMLPYVIVADEGSWRS